MNDRRTQGNLETDIPGIEEFGCPDIPLIARTKSGCPVYVGKVNGEGAFSTDRAERNANHAYIVKAWNNYEEFIELAHMVAGRMYDDGVGQGAVQLAEKLLDSMGIERWNGPQA